MTMSIDSPSGAPRASRGRSQALMLIGFFLLPLLAAFALYYGVEGWRPAGSTNKGELISPARPLGDFTLTAALAGPVSAADLDGKWTLVYLADGSCDARCQEALILMRQTRLALNDDMLRVQRLLLMSGDCCEAQYLEQEHAGLLTARVDDEAGAQLLTHFPAGADTVRSGNIYIIDPLGNLMMSHAEQVPQKGLLEDLKKLLKLSHIG